MKTHWRQDALNAWCGAAPRKRALRLTVFQEDVTCDACVAARTHYQELLRYDGPVVDFWTVCSCARCAKRRSQTT